MSQLFQSVIGRFPDVVELTGMADQLATGASQAGLQSALVNTGSAGGYLTVTAPVGDANLNAPPGSPTLFVFDDIAFGHDVIAGFDPQRDTIELSHNFVSDPATLLAQKTIQIGSDTVIWLNPSQSIQLNGVAQAALIPGNFNIV